MPQAHETAVKIIQSIINAQPQPTHPFDKSSVELSCSLCLSIPAGFFNLSFSCGLKVLYLLGKINFQGLKQLVLIH